MRVPGWITNLKKPGSLWGTLVGWACICVGIAGLILPVIPGLAFLAAGLLILSTRYRWASFCLRWLKRQARRIRSRRARRKEEDSELVTTQRG